MKHPHWNSPEFVEQRVLPVLLAFALGVLAWDEVVDRRQADVLAAAQAKAVQARKAATQAQDLAGLYATACGPLLSLPVQSTPEIDLAAEALAMKGVQP
jgi:hypothetical protein